MPSPATYVYQYYMGTSMPTAATIFGGASTSNSSVSDTADGSADDQTFLGGAVDWSAVSSYPVTFHGLTAGGDLIVRVNYDVGSPGYFILSNNGGLAGSAVGDIASGPYTYCFLAGSAIATRAGEVPVEELRIGMPVLTTDGREVPVKWVGRQTVVTHFRPAERLSPVRIAAGALGDGLPYADLTVTADHGMLVDGVICHAGALVNGTSITRVPLAEMGETYTVYHVETEEHEIILANGAPAETFIDNVGRQAFDNFAEYDALYGEVPEMQELPLPRAMSARQVPRSIRARLAGRCVA